MKIAQVVSLCESVPPTAKNGLEFVVSWLTEELVKRGHEVTLFAPANSVTKAKLVSLLPEGLERDRDRWDQHFFAFWNTAITATFPDKFDVIHCHNRQSASITPYTKSAVVETIHHPLEEDEGLNRLHQTANKFGSLGPILECYKKVNYVAVSEFQEKRFCHYEKTFFKKHSTIYNGIPIEKFEFNAKPGDYLLFLGYINKNKGADVAVRVAKSLNLKLILAGSYVGEEAFFDEHIRPHLNDKIQYVGPVNFEQKNELYKNALAKLAPLLWDEPFGLTIVESQACGTPVIAFNKGAASEIISHGKTGFVVDSEEEMIETIKKIKTINRSDCRDWVEKNFSVSKMVDEYEELYKKLV